MISSFIISASKTDTKIEEPKSRTVMSLGIDKVVDGTTFVINGQTIKLWGVKPPKEDSYHSWASKAYLDVILNEASFSCYYKYKDPNKNFVMQCFSQKQDIGSILVRMGTAMDDKEISSGFYESDEEFAKENKYGIWKEEER